MRWTILISATFVASLTALPVAQARDLIDVFDEWSVFSDREGGKLFCFIGAEPKTRAPKTKNGKPVVRGDSYVLVTHRPAAKAIGVISVRGGYDYKPASEVQMIIDRKSHRLFTQDDLAWAYDDKGDRTLVRAMRNGHKLTVKGTSKRGTNTTDTYSLKGFTKALKAAGKACKVR